VIVLKVISWMKFNKKYLQQVLDRSKKTNKFAKFCAELTSLLSAVSTTAIEIPADEIIEELQFRELLEIQTDKKREDKDAKLVWHLDHLVPNENKASSKFSISTICNRLLLIFTVCTVIFSLLINGSAIMSGERMR